jgi:Lipase (class 3)
VRCSSLPACRALFRAHAFIAYAVVALAQQRLLPSSPCSRATQLVCAPCAGHPPIRGRGNWLCGTRPHVHAGFLRSWQANGLNQKLLKRIRGLVYGATPKGKLPRQTVYVTGDAAIRQLLIWRDQKCPARTSACMQETLTCCAPPLIPAKTGHSLGGSLAMLAAYDIAARLPTLTVRCYTYGAPRTGNRAFAEDYGRVVEDTWHIINGEPRWRCQL